jgi:hypothetical protein
MDVHYLLLTDMVYCSCETVYREMDAPDATKANGGQCPDILFRT